jgi:DNA-binding GntR family transcriptional regulator
VKEGEARNNAQDEAQKVEIEELWKKLAEANEKYAVAKASKETSEWSRARLEKNIEELRESKERCFEKILGLREKFEKQLFKSRCLFL